MPWLNEALDGIWAKGRMVRISEKLFSWKFGMEVCFPTCLFCGHGEEGELS